MLIIGDVHGKFQRYVELASTAERSIQVGDLGVGFPGWNQDRLILDDLSNDHKFIRGNHDNPAACKSLARNIPDGSFNESLDAFFCGGAFSIDKCYRIDGVDYWRDEELSYAKFLEAYDVYVEAKPRFVFTHDLPESIAHNFFSFYDGSQKSVTRHAFQAMFEAHQPELWVFGHWHRSVSGTFSGTRFKCLNELETITIKM